VSGMRTGLRTDRVSGVPLRLQPAGNALLVHAKGGPDPQALAFAAGLAADPVNTLAVIDLPFGALDEAWERVARLLGGGPGGLRLVFGRATPEESRRAGQRIADRLGRVVLAPDGELLPTAGGGLFIPADHGSGWLRLRPGRPAERDSHRFPKPLWEFSTIDRPWETSPYGVVEPVPSGVWVRSTRPSPPLAGWQRLVDSLPSHPHIMNVVIGSPGGPAVPLADVVRFWDTVLSSVRSWVRFVHYGPVSLPEGSVSLGQELADAFEQRVVLYAGMPTVEGGGVDSGPAPVRGLLADGSPGWRPFAAEIVYSPRDGADRPQPPALVGLRVPLAELPQLADGLYQYAADAVLEIVQSGLWLRPVTEPANGDDVRRLPGLPGHPVILYDRSSPQTAERMRTLAEDMLWRLDPAGREVFQVAPADDPGLATADDEHAWTVPPTADDWRTVAAAKAAIRRPAHQPPWSTTTTTTTETQLPASAQPSTQAPIPRAAQATPQVHAPIPASAQPSAQSQAQIPASILASPQAPAPISELAQALALAPAPAQVPTSAMTPAPNLAPAQASGPASAPQVHTPAFTPAPAPFFASAPTPTSTPPPTSVGEAPAQPQLQSQPPQAPATLAPATLAGPSAGTAAARPRTESGSAPVPAASAPQATAATSADPLGAAEPPATPTNPTPAQSPAPQAPTPQAPAAPASPVPLPSPAATPGTPQAPGPQIPGPPPAAVLPPVLPTEPTPAPTKPVVPDPAPPAVPAPSQPMAMPRIRMESDQPAAAAAPAPTPTPVPAGPPPAPAPDASAATGTSAATSASAGAPAATGVRVQPAPAPAARALPPERGVDQERAWVRRTFSSQYNAVAGTVSRVMSESPGLRGVSRAVAGDALTDLVAVRLYLSGDSAAVDQAIRAATAGSHVPLARCVASGLLRLPSYRGTARLRARITPAERAWYQEGRVATEWAFCTARTEPHPMPDGTDFLIWSMTARRTNLLDPGTPDRVVFLPGTSFKVLRAAEDGERPVVLLRELSPSEDDRRVPLDEIALQSLERSLALLTSSERDGGGAAADRSGHPAEPLGSPPGLIVAPSAPRPRAAAARRGPSQGGKP
jgi:hypothetical protein